MSLPTRWTEDPETVDRVTVKNKNAAQICSTISFNSKNISLSLSHANGLSMVAPLAAASCSHHVLWLSFATLSQNPWAKALLFIFGSTLLHMSYVRKTDETKFSSVLFIVTAAEVSLSAYPGGSFGWIFFFLFQPVIYDKPHSCLAVDGMFLTKTSRSHSTLKWITQRVTESLNEWCVSDWSARSRKYGGAVKVWSSDYMWVCFQFEAFFFLWWCRKNSFRQCFLTIMAR